MTKSPLLTERDTSILEIVQTVLPDSSPTKQAEVVIDIGTLETLEACAVASRERLADALRPQTTNN